MRKRLLLFLLTGFVIVVLILVLLWRSDDELKSIDVAVVDFEYDISICDEYFDMVECIINNDNDMKYTKQMRIELKNEVKEMQEKWRELSREELFNKCSEELARFDNDVMSEKLRLMNCSRN